LVVLDEPFRFLSEQYRAAGRQILESLADEMDCQFILVTHIKELSAGQVIHM
jgi:ABC-type sulfate/molybdate transport systems ATPase subunit